MKKYFSYALFLLMLICTSMTAQTKSYVNKLHYWFDSPTPVNPVLVDPTLYVADSTMIDFTNIQPDISGLSSGAHTFYVSVRDQSGNWSSPAISKFIIGTIPKQHITKMRYWFDSPTPNSPVEGTPSYNTDSSEVTYSNSSVDISLLAAGTHKMYVSTRDHSGKWGTASVTQFFVGSIQKNYITKGQYWFNSATPLNTVDVDPSYNGDSSIANFSNVQISVSSLADGDHSLFFRTRDMSGKWGTASKSTFTIGGEQKRFIVKGQYWFNNAIPTNPTEFNPVFVSDSTTVSANLSNVQVPNGLPNGKHTVYIRYQDNKNRWGSAQTIQFVQNAELAPPTISQMEYFFGNTDPGQGSASQPRSGTASGFGGRSIAYSDSFSVEPLSLPLGVNKFSVRFKSNKEEWGPTISKTFSILTRPILLSSIKDSLRFDTLISGRNSATKTFYIKNTGDADLKLKVGTTPSTQWTLKLFAPKDTVAKDSISISKDSFLTDSAAILVTYTPVKSGAVKNFIRFVTNDSVKINYDLPVSAFADSAKGKLFTSSDTLNFGQVNVGIHEFRSITLRNSGSDSIVIQLSNPSFTNVYTLYQLTRSRLGYQSLSDTVKLVMEFAPLASQVYNTTMSVTVYNRETQFLEQKFIHVRGQGIINPFPAIKSDVAFVNFGGVNSRDGKDTTVKFNVRNVGQQQLMVSQMSVSDTSVFKIVSPAILPFGITYNSTREVLIQFKPKQGTFKSYNGTLTIRSNSADKDSVLVLPMNGDATNGPPFAALILSDSAVDYGSVTIGFASKRTLAITNAGANRKLNVTSITSGNSSFTTSIATPFLVPEDSTVTFDVTFAPSNLGSLAVDLTIQSDANTSSTKIVKLKGNGVATPTAIIQVALTSIQFPNTKVNNSVIQYYTIKNSGNDSLKATSISRANNSSAFAINKTSMTLAPNVTDSIRVTFTPAAIGAYNDTLVIVSNVPRFTVPISGSGAQLEIRTDTTFTLPNISLAPNSSPTVGVSLSASLGSNAVAYLFLKKAGKTQFDSLEMDSNPIKTKFQKPIPDTSIADRGVAYYIKISGSTDVLTYPATNPTTNPYYFTVSFPSGIEKSQVQPVGKTQSFYRMISVPLDGIAGSFSDVLNSFGAYDKNKWRLFRYQLGNYVEHNQSGFENFAAGKGYWFITTISGKVKSGAGTSTKPSTPFNIDLQPEWNQIGAPFNFPVAWSDVTGKGSNAGQLFAYTGSDYQPSVNLKPWEGYFVKNSSNNIVTIGIPPQESATPSAFGKFSSNGSPNLIIGEWMVQLKACAGETEDQFNFIGVKHTSSDEFDLNDIEESPKQPGEFLKLQFNHSDWKDHPDRYGYDFRSPDEAGRYWDFEIHTNSTQEKILLSIDQFESVPKNFDIVMIDPDAKTAIDLRKMNEFSVPSVKKEITKNFRILVGTKNFIEQNNFGVLTVPVEYSLSQNYPNPFNPSTTINFALPKQSVVVITVFDILGKEVKTLLNETMNEGYHFVQWNSFNTSDIKVSSGIYFCRIIAKSIDGSKNFVQTTKMVLMK